MVENFGSFLQTVLRREDLLVFIRYAVVGVGQNAAFYAFTLVLLTLGWTATQALMLLYPVAVCVTFFLNRSWAFRAATRNRGQFVRYVLAYAGAYPVSLALVAGLEAVGTPSWAASLLTMVCMAIGLYLTLKFFVFTEPARREA